MKRLDRVVTAFLSGESKLDIKHFELQDYIGKPDLVSIANPTNEDKRLKRNGCNDLRTDCSVLYWWSKSETEPDHPSRLRSCNQPLIHSTLLRLDRRRHHGQNTAHFRVKISGRGHA
ncbi:hypothetical protein N9B17_01490 [Rhodopirellula sp.]|nr:hypothetical protein [Rhodopirellula sp.]